MSEQIEYNKFIGYFKTLTTFNGLKYDEILVDVHKYALNYGLAEEDMTLITQISFKHKIGFMRIRKLLKCLLPRRYCSTETVEIILKYLTFYNRKLRPLAIKLLLQWLIAIIEYSLIESKTPINNYYYLFIYFMKFEIIDVPASKLVYLLTSSDDVSRWQTTNVLKLYKLSNNAKHFAALLYLFKCYRPDVVPEKFPVYSVHKAFGTISSSILKDILYAKNRIRKIYNIPQDVENIIWMKFGSESINYKRKGIQLIPSNFNIDDSSCGSLLSIQNISKYNLSSNAPSCVLSLLNNTAGACILAFCKPITHARFSYQLYFVLYDAFLDRNLNVSYAERDRTLEKVARLQNHLQQAIPVVSKFIGQYLMRWDGQEHEQHLYSIMEWIYVKSYRELHQCVLNYLLDIFMSNPIKTKCKILNYLGNFAVNIIKTYSHRVLKEIPSLFLNVKELYDFVQLFQQLYNFIENLCLYGIYIEKNNTLIIHTILIVYENILIAAKNANINNLVISDNIPYAALFSSNPNCLNLMCKLMNEYPKSVSQNVKQDYVDCLWNKNGFNLNNSKSIFYSLNKNEKQINGIETKLRLENHYAFTCYTYLNESTEPEERLNNIRNNHVDIFKFLQQNA